MGVSGSWVHSLQATSQALQPMQRVVSVKKPTAVAISIPQQVWRDLGEPPLAGEQVEGKAGQLVDHRHSGRVLAQVEGEQVMVAGLASVHPDVWELRLVPVD